MNRQIFAWDRSRSQLRQETHWREILTMLGLLVAATFVSFFNLHRPELTELEKIGFNEFINLVNSHFYPFNFIFNQFNSAFLYHPFWIRFPSALLTALSVPLFYLLGKEIFKIRLSALLSAVIYLTFLPVFIYSRINPSHATMLFLSIAFLTCGLRSRRDLRWSVGVGLTGIILLLWHSWAGLTIISALLVFFLWDTPRLITSGFFWLGSLLGGMLPLSYWIITFEKTENIALGTVVKQISGSFSPLSFLGVLLFTLPWLIFFKEGLKLTLKEKNWSWAKLIIILGIFTGLITAFSPFFHPFEISLLIYPVVALATGLSFSHILQWPSDRRYPPTWGTFFLILAFLSLISSLGVYFQIFPFNLYLTPFFASKPLILLTASLILTFTSSGLLILRQNKQFISILIWGLYVSSLIYFS